MRNTFLLLLITVLQAYAYDTYSQNTRLTLNLNNVTVANVLEEIQNSSEFYFLFNSKLIDVEKEVSISMKDEKISEILTSLFSGTGVNYLVFDRQIILTPSDVISLSAAMQQLKITGIVTGKDGVPLPGVNVVVTGTTQGTMTDIAGKYSIDIPKGAKSLTFSFVGMEPQEISIGTLTQINVTMAESAIGLEDVVVVGYGTQKKVNLTGAVASINSAVLKKIPPVGSATNTLAGRLPGLISQQGRGLPGRDAALLSIRGFGNPLVIVDGVESGFNNVDVNEIESVSILKDGSAAIYGARAGNGVILVTTKRGKDGKPTIILNSSYSFQTITNYPKPMSSGQIAEADRETKIHAGLSEAQQQYSQEDVKKYYEGTDPDYPNTNWYDFLIKPFAPMQQHNLSISGGSDRIKYFGLFGFMDQETFWKKNGGDFKRYNIRSNIDAKITDNLSMQINLSNINEVRKFPARDNNGDWDWVVWQDFWGTTAIYPSSLPDPTKLPYGGAGAYGSAAISTNSEISGFMDNDVQDIKVGVVLKYEFPFVKGLSARLYTNYSQNYNNTKRMNKPVSFYTYNYQSDIYSLTGTWSPQADLRQQSHKSRDITNQFSFNYDRVIANNHTISVLALYESIDYSSDYIDAMRSHFLTPSIEYLFAGSTNYQYADGSASEMGRKSFIGRLNYSFKNKYFFEASLRTDASAKFPPEKRWGYFPSLSGAWKISEENFIKDNIGWLEILKLRGGVGNAGYDNVSNFAYMSGYKLDRNYIFGNSTMNGLTSAGLANANLTWEKMSTYNLGLDLSLYKAKLYGEFDVFYRKREGIPVTRSLSLPYSFGASLPPENLNSSNDRGFEAMIGNRGHQGDISWDISGNVSWSRSKWDHFEEPDYSADPERARRYQISGQWVDRIIGYKTDGLYTSQEEINAMTFDQDKLGNISIKPGDIKYIDVNKDGMLDWKDQVDIGKGTMPHWMFGLSTNLQYKNFDFSVLFQGAAGNNAIIDISGSQNYFTERWTDANNNPNALIPRLGSTALGGGFSDFFLKKASYIRLKTLNLGYNLPKELLKFAKINDLRIYFAGTNLLTLDKLKKYAFDPEFPSGTHLYYPQQRTFTFGLTLSL